MTPTEAMSEWLLGRIRWRLTTMTELALQCLAGQVDPVEAQLRMTLECDHLDAGVDELVSMIDKECNSLNTPGRTMEDSEDG